jgi:hypothetical protein
MDRVTPLSIVSVSRNLTAIRKVGRLRNWRFEIVQLAVCKASFALRREPIRASKGSLGCTLPTQLHHNATFSDYCDITQLVYEQLFLDRIAQVNFDTAEIAICGTKTRVNALAEFDRQARHRDAVDISLPEDHWEAFYIKGVPMAGEGIGQIPNDCAVQVHVLTYRVADSRGFLETAVTRSHNELTTTSPSITVDRVIPLGSTADRARRKGGWKSPP